MLRPGDEPHVVGWKTSRAERFDGGNCMVAVGEQAVYDRHAVHGAANVPPRTWNANELVSDSRSPLVGANGSLRVSWITPKISALTCPGVNGNPAGGFVPTDGFPNVELTDLNP